MSARFQKRHRGKSSHFCQSRSIDFRKFSRFCILFALLAVISFYLFRVLHLVCYYAANVYRF